MAGRGSQGKDCRDPFRRNKTTSQSQKEKNRQERFQEEPEYKDVLWNLMQEPLHSLNESLTQPKGQTPCDIFNNWCRRTAQESYPGIGSLALAIPSFFPGRHEIEVKGCRGNSGLTIREAQAAYSKSATPESTWKGDHAQRTIGRCFRILNARLETGGKNSMFIISDLPYDYLLSWLRCPKMDEGYRTTFPKIFTEQSAFINIERINEILKDRGESDLFVLHLEKGIIFIQVKSVSVKPSQSGHGCGAGVQTKEESTSKLCETMQKAEGQLRRDVELLQAVMDRSRSWPQMEAQRAEVVRLVLALPNVHRDVAKDLQDRGVIKKDIILLCQEDTMQETNRSIVSSEVESDIEGFEQWWNSSLTNLTDGLFTLDCMQEVIGKYIGPLSAVREAKSNNWKDRLHKFWDCVEYNGLLFCRRLLTDRQTEITDKKRKPGSRVYLKGPPGSGKTLLLGFQGLQFVKANTQHVVVVVNMYRGEKGRAIGQHLHDLIVRDCNDSQRQRVLHLTLDVEETAFVSEVKKFIVSANFSESPKKNVLCVSRKDGSVYANGKNALFLVDEIYVEQFWTSITSAFKENFKQSEVWCAGLFSNTPEGFTEECLEFSLRCPPSVQNLLYHLDWNLDRRKTYRRDTQWLEVTSNGPIPLCVCHETHVTSGHDPRVVNCPLCAADLANVLKFGARTRHRKLRANSAPPASKNQTAQDDKWISVSDRVVLLVNMPRSLYTATACGQYIETTKEQYDLYMNSVETSSFVTTLRKHLEVLVVVQLAPKTLPPPCNLDPEAVTATWLYNFQGLEAGVVIFLPGDPADVSDARPADASSSAARPPDTSRAEGCACCSFLPDSGTAGSDVRLRDIPAPGLKVTAKAPANVSQDSNGLAACFQRKVGTSGLREAVGGWQKGGNFNIAGVGGGGAGAACTPDVELRNQQKSPSLTNSLTPYLWTTRDVARYSSWDKTNAMVACSRSLSLVILLIP